MAQSGASGESTQQMLNYVIDLEDEGIEDTRLHLAAFMGDVDQVRQILQDPEKKYLLRNLF